MVSVGKKPRALIAMSGGVDSSVAALLAQRMGYDCTGVTMKLFEGGGAGVSGQEGRFPAVGEAACVRDRGSKRPGRLYPTDGVDDAKRVAASLGMAHEVADFTKEFREAVIEPFVASYEDGATPNPCVDCNKNIKFGRLYDHARAGL